MMKWNVHLVLILTLTLGYGNNLCMLCACDTPSPATAETVPPAPLGKLACPKCPARRADPRSFVPASEEPTQRHPGDGSCCRVAPSYVAPLPAPLIPADAEALFQADDALLATSSHDTLRLDLAVDVPLRREDRTLLRQHCALLL